MGIQKIRVQPRIVKRQKNRLPRSLLKIQGNFGVLLLRL